jgi:hypothetical protein
MIGLNILLAPIAGLAAFHYAIRFRKLMARIRFSFKRRTPSIIALISMRREILNTMHEIVHLHIPNHENPR